MKLCAGSLLTLAMTLAPLAYHNILKIPRNDDQLHQDGYSCDAQVGPDRNGVPTSAAYKQCMLSRSWRYQSVKREPAPKTWIDSDTGLTCHEILNGFGSECSNF